MKLVRLTPQHPHLNQIRSWYVAAFPPEERRKFTDLVALLTCPDMHLCSLMQDDGQPVGFIIYWYWPDVDVLFIEHFAINPDLRGQQLGQQALTEVLNIDADYFLLETELPTDDIHQRRIRFYERQGFQVNKFAYEQPPYPAIPMKLMSLPSIKNEEEFDKFSALIDKRVYSYSSMS